LHSLGGVDWSLSVDWVSKSVENSSKHLFSYRNIYDLSSSHNDVSFLDVSIVTKNHNTNIISFKIQRNTLDSGREFNHFSGLYFV
jgi:hypothetical protein